MRPFNLSSVFFLTATLLPLNSFALNVQRMRPAIGEMNGSQVSTTQILPAGQMTVAMDADYVSQPLEVGAAGDNRFFGIVDQFVTFNLSAAVGLTRHLSVGLSIPVNAWHNIAPVLIPDRDTGGLDMGDMRLGLKAQIIDPEKWKGPGIGAYANLIVPTGDGSIYFGEDNLAGEVGIITDKIMGRHHVTVNLGGRARQKETFLNLEVPAEFLYGAGYHLTVGKEKNWKIVAEVNGSTTLKRFFTQEISSPVETTLTGSKLFGSKLKVNLGAGFGLNNGYGSPDFRVFSGAQYSFPAWNSK